MKVVHVDVDNVNRWWGVQVEPRLHAVSRFQRVRESQVTIRPKINSNDFGWFLELISRFEFEFCRRGNFFVNDSNFLVCSKFNHTQCGPYMCLCCGLFVPTQFLFECCGVCDNS